MLYEVITTVADEHAGLAEFVLSRTPGINGWARAVKARKDIDAVREAVLEAAAAIVARGASTFKVEARRSDKSFPLGSYEIASGLGADVLERFPSLRVDVRSPEASYNFV